MMNQEEKNACAAAFLSAAQRLIEEDKLKHLAGGPFRAGDPVSFVTGASSVFMGTGEPISKSGQTALRDNTIPLTRQPDGSFSVPRRLKP